MSAGRWSAGKNADGLQQTARDAFLAAGFGDLAPKPRTDYEALKEALGELKGKDELVQRHRAHEFRQWEQALDLPDPEEVLAKAMAAIAAGRPVEDGFLPGRADQVLAFLGALADRVLHHNNTRQRWEAGMEILGLVWKSWKELAIIGGAALAQGYKAGYRVPADFSGQALPLMVRAGPWASATWDWPWE